MSRYQTELVVETLRPGEDGYDASARGFFATTRPAVVALPAIRTRSRPPCATRPGRISRLPFVRAGTARSADRPTRAR